MFQWIKVLNSLSREDNLLEKMEKRYTVLTQKMQETDQKLKEAQELEKKISDNKAALEQIENQIGQYEKMVQDKLREIKNSASKYLDEVNAKVQSYDSNISVITGKLKELHEAVAEFQR